jgi:glycerate 2-kinase
VTDPRALLRDLFVAAVARMDPEARVRDALEHLEAWFGPASVRDRDDVHVIAVGKAACAMARGAADAAGHGLVIAPGPGEAPWPVMIGAHPVPDERSERAGRALLAFVQAVPADGLLLALISGGASSLAAVPIEGVTLADKVARVRAVMASGAPIEEINRVRTSLSAIKGGKLARACAAPVITLVCSDVVGDDPAIVGSGPTVDAAAPGRVRVIAGVEELAIAAMLEADRRGIDAAAVGGVVGDVGAVADELVAALDGPHALLALAGEPTVRLPDPPGTGGRAVQLALLVAKRIAGRAGVAILAAGSDGVDGTGPAAGAIVDGDTWARLAAAGIDGDAALARCDAGAALAAIGATVVTGPTGVNHADLMLVWRRQA